MQDINSSIELIRKNNQTQKNVATCKSFVTLKHPKELENDPLLP